MVSNSPLICARNAWVALQENRRSGAYDLKQHLDIATRGVRIGTDFLMRLFRQSCEIRLRDGLVLDVQLDSEAKAAALATEHWFSSMSSWNVEACYVVEVVTVRQGTVRGGPFVAPHGSAANLDD